MGVNSIISVLYQHKGGTEQNFRSGMAPQPSRSDSACQLPGVCQVTIWQTWRWFWEGWCPVVRSCLASETDFIHPWLLIEDLCLRDSDVILLDLLRFNNLFTGCFFHPRVKIQCKNKSMSPYSHCCTKFLLEVSHKTWQPSFTSKKLYFYHHLCRCCIHSEISIQAVLWAKC